MSIAGRSSGGNSSGSPKCVRIFRIAPGSVMKAISRISPPHPGHCSGNSSPTQAMSLAQAIREGACERGFARVSQQPSAAAARGLRDGSSCGRTCSRSGTLIDHAAKPVEPRVRVARVTGGIREAGHGERDVYLPRDVTVHARAQEHDGVGRLTAQEVVGGGVGRARPIGKACPLAKGVGGRNIPLRGRDRDRVGVADLGLEVMRRDRVAGGQRDAVDVAGRPRGPAGGLHGLPRGEPAGMAQGL